MVLLDGEGPGRCPWLNPQILGCRHCRARRSPLCRVGLCQRPVPLGEGVCVSMETQQQSQRAEARMAVTHQASPHHRFCPTRRIALTTRTRPQGATARECGETEADTVCNLPRTGEGEWTLSWLLGAERSVHRPTRPQSASRRTKATLEGLRGLLKGWGSCWHQLAKSWGPARALEMVRPPPQSPRCSSIPPPSRHLRAATWSECARVSQGRTEQGAQATEYKGDSAGCAGTSGLGVLGVRSELAPTA